MTIWWVRRLVSRRNYRIVVLSVQAAQPLNAVRLKNASEAVMASNAAE
jgi:hypothetical protein